jgi:hypothetical protein
MAFMVMAGSGVSDPAIICAFSGLGLAPDVFAVEFAECLKREGDDSVSIAFDFGDFPVLLDVAFESNDISYGDLLAFDCGSVHLVIAGGLCVPTSFTSRSFLKLSRTIRTPIRTIFAGHFACDSSVGIRFVRVSIVLGMAMKSATFRIPRYQP